MCMKDRMHSAIKELRIVRGELFLKKEWYQSLCHWNTVIFHTLCPVLARHNFFHTSVALGGAAIDVSVAVDSTCWFTCKKSCSD